jgi:rhodanese-related sulfurtransferase
MEELMLGDARARLNRLKICCHPFSMLSEHRAQEAMDALRIVDLGDGESITVRPHGAGTDYIYIVEGEPEVAVGAASGVRMGATTDESRPVVLEPGTPPVTFSAAGHVLLARIESEVLDYLVSWDAIGRGLGTEQDDVAGRVAAIQHCLAFRRLPLECVEEAFRRMTKVAVTKGQDVVRQGEPGDAFYVIESGRAEVWRTGIYDDEPQKVDEMGPGEPFGEDALVMKGARGATVRMTEDGVLLRMGKEDFDELIGQQLIDRVEPPIAKAFLDAGYVPLDVRYEEEFEEHHIPNATLIPLPELRHRFAELDPSRHYLVYCKSGGRSAVGTLLLRQRNFHAVSLATGLRDWPYEMNHA